PRAGRPAEEAGELALDDVLVEDLDRDALELRGLPIDVVGLHVGRPADGRLEGSLHAPQCRSRRRRMRATIARACGTPRTCAPASGAAPSRPRTTMPSTTGWPPGKTRWSANAGAAPRSAAAQTRASPGASGM